MAPAAFAEDPVDSVSEQVEVVQGAPDPEDAPSEDSELHGSETEVPAEEAGSEVTESTESSEEKEAAPTEGEASSTDSDEVSEQAALTAEGTETTSEISSAKLEWGVRESFRNYINGPIADGIITTLGGTATTSPGAAETIFRWSGGNGTLNADGSGFDASFGSDDGVRFQGHKHGADYILDLQFTHPRIVATSSTEAELYLDVEGREYVGISTIGERYTLENVHFADVVLPDPEVSETAYTWTDATATMTDEGLEAFGGFYGPADRELDPLTFSTSSDGGENPTPAPTATTTGITASQQSAEQGAEVALTATVAPSTAAGSVQFFNAGEAFGSAVSVSGGAAVLQTKSLPVGSNSLTAVFTPADPAVYASSTSASVTVTVTKKPDEPTEGKVSGARLDWGVKQSFRNYVTGPIAKGQITRLETTGQFTWSGGSGTAMSDGSKANVSFGKGKGKGVYFEGHEMKNLGVHALELSFTNPRIEIRSASTARLYLDVEGREFKSMSEAGAKFAKSNVHFADIALSSPTAQGNALVWSNAEATLTAAGAEAFGGFYGRGEVLDPLTFSFPLDTDVITKTPTTTKLTASPATAERGSQVTLTATVSPQIAGSVTFSYGGKQIGKAIAVKSGKAALKTSELPAGIHSITASFAPSSSDYGSSVSNSVRVTITTPQSPGSTPPASSGQSAGSLSWGISARFAAYTTCNGNENFGMSHCAKGSISTSGVGAGYLFPQASGSDWNRSTQTGTVNYSGTVTFSGYGLTMFQVVNPSITVTGPTSATLRTGNTTPYGSASYQLDLASGSKSVGANGEVTWSNVPVLGSLGSGGAGGSGNQTIGLDALTFTVGAEARVSYGSTQAGADAKQTREPAAAPPATTGITVLTDAEKLTAGGRIEIEAAGFEPDEDGILVVIYSDPVVLDEDAKADANGTVRWSGTLPRDLEGEHTITLQGSINAGAVIDILPKDAAKKSAKQAALADVAEQDLAAEQISAAGIVPGSALGGMSLWEWWASALGLVAIASCTTLLAVRQRRAAE